MIIQTGQVKHFPISGAITVQTPVLFERHTEQEFANKADGKQYDFSYRYGLKMFNLLSSFKKQLHKIIKYNHIGHYSYHYVTKQISV